MSYMKPIIIILSLLALPLAAVAAEEVCYPLPARVGKKDIQSEISMCFSQQRLNLSYEKLMSATNQKEPEYYLKEVVDAIVTANFDKFKNFSLDQNKAEGQFKLYLKVFGGNKSFLVSDKFFLGDHIYYHIKLGDAKAAFFPVLMVKSEGRYLQDTAQITHPLAQNLSFLLGYYGSRASQIPKEKQKYNSQVEFFKGSNNEVLLRFQSYPTKYPLGNVHSKKYWYPKKYAEVTDFISSHYDKIKSGSKEAIIEDYDEDSKKKLEKQLNSSGTEKKIIDFQYQEAGEMDVVNFVDAGSFVIAVYDGNLSFLKYDVLVKEKNTYRIANYNTMANIELLLQTKELVEFFKSERPHLNTGEVYNEGQK